MKEVDCKSCGAAVVWARFDSGKSAPFELDAEGSWLLTYSSSEGFVGVEKYDPQTEEALDTASAMMPIDLVWRRATIHFARCPDADKWRRDRG